MEAKKEILPGEYGDIGSYASFVKAEPIDKGLSGDKKYRIETSDGRRLLLRVSDASEYERRRAIFDKMRQLSKLGVPMPRPVDFGLCNGGKSVYQLLTWCDGENLEGVLPVLSGTEQYMLGQKAGEILRIIHSIPAPDHLGDWSDRYLGVNDGRVKSFQGCGVSIAGSDALLRYYEEHKPLLSGRSQCFHHGDYHVGNFLMTSDLRLSVIDWEPLDYDNFADPWEEFNRLGNSEVVPPFATGLIRGYFQGEPPVEFWRLLAFYLSAGALMLVSWAFYRQKDCLAYSIQNANHVLRWFDGMKNPVPAWYLENC